MRAESPWCYCQQPNKQTNREDVWPFECLRDIAILFGVDKGLEVSWVVSCFDFLVSVLKQAVGEQDLAGCAAPLLFSFQGCGQLGWSVARPSSLSVMICEPVSTQWQAFCSCSSRPVDKLRSSPHLVWGPLSSSQCARVPQFRQARSYPHRPRRPRWGRSWCDSASISCEFSPFPHSASHLRSLRPTLLFNGNT